MKSAYIAAFVCAFLNIRCLALEIGRNSNRERRHRIDLGRRISVVELYKTSDAIEDTARYRTKTPDDTESPTSNGKGKGGSSSGKGKGSTKSTKSSKSSKGTKSSKSSSKGSKSQNKPTSMPGTATPTKQPSPRPTPIPTDAPRPPSDDMPSTRPPIGTSEPTVSPIQIPTQAPSTRVILTPYGLDYTLTDPRMPFRSEYVEVIALTTSYLQNYFQDLYDTIPSSILNDFLTVFTGASFGSPILIEYASEALFDPSSEAIPDQAALDMNLTEAFLGDNLVTFLEMLQSLPADNVFSTTINVALMESTLGEQRGNDNKSRSHKATTAAGVSAAIAGMALVGVGLILYQRQKVQKANEVDNEEILKEHENSSIAETLTTACSTENEEVSVLFERIPCKKHEPISKQVRWLDNPIHTDQDVDDVAMELSEILESVSLS